jgi:hypothetical protein
MHISCRNVTLCVRYTRHGFTLGHHWGYHGLSNRSLKVKLHRVYALFCPALLTGDFIHHGGTLGSDPKHTSSSEPQTAIGYEPNAQVPSYFNLLLHRIDRNCVDQRTKCHCLGTRTTARLLQLLTAVVYMQRRCVLLLLTPY